MHVHRRLAMLAATALALVACTGGQTPSTTSTTAPPTSSTLDGDARQVEIVMTEFAFEPSTVSVTAGETVAFTFVNQGEVEHEARIDTVHGVEDHIAGGHEGHEHGAGPLAVLVQPGESETLMVTFEEGDDYEVIACTLPGHYEAGMVMSLEGLSTMGDGHMDDGHMGDVNVLDPEDMEAVAGQVQVLGVLAGVDAADTAGFHGMSEALANGEFSGREAGTVDKVIATISAVSWPHELEETAGSFLADLEALFAALEAEDVEASAEAAHAVHESQHGFSHDSYAYITGGHEDHG